MNRFDEAPDKKLTPEARESWEQHLKASELVAERARQVLGIIAIEKEAEVGQPHFDKTERRTLYEGQEPEQLVKFRAGLLARLSMLESDVHLINSVLEDKGCE